jgi:hypothetical protein
LGRRMDWQTTLMPASDPDGRPVLAALAKRTYTFAPGAVTVSARQMPFVEADVYADAGNPLYSEVLAESDLVACKPLTDVVVLGKAHAPSGRTAYHLDCGVQVGALARTVRVYGARRIRERALGGLQFTDPEPFTEMELGYRFAFGGVARAKDGTLYPYPPNPIGCGMAIRGAVDDPSSVRVPTQEDPGAPLDAESIFLRRYEQWSEAPRPVSLGWTRRNFFPRYTYAGVLPEYLAAATANREALREQYPSLIGAAIPKMDLRFYQGASEGLWGGPLAGDEPVGLSFLDPDHPTLEFALPGDRPIMVLDKGDDATGLKAVLQTVVIDAERKLVMMVWRGAVEYGGVEELAGGMKMGVRIEE